MHNEKAYFISVYLMSKPIYLCMRGKFAEMPTNWTFILQIYVDMLKWYKTYKACGRKNLGPVQGWSLLIQSSSATRNELLGNLQSIRNLSYHDQYYELLNLSNVVLAIDRLTERHRKHQPQQTAELKNKITIALEHQTYPWLCTKHYLDTSWVIIL